VLVDLFDYELPAELIAQHPAPRGASRLLTLGRADGRVRHRRFDELPGLLVPGDLLVVNDARVSPARLRGEDAAGRAVELLVLQPGAVGEVTCLARPGRRARTGARIALPEGVCARVLRVLENGRRVVEFSPPLTAEILERIGHVPLPPYIKRPDTELDRQSYQTVFAKTPGAVAAPTAGLHFTEEMLARLRSRGVGTAELSLIVGAGTFKPVSSRDTDDHVMDEEEVQIPEETLRRAADAKAHGGRMVAVGTTVVRALESWTRGDAARFRTSLFITPGFEFRAVDALLTNFHLPRSTLLMLVCAFAGREPVLAAYREAVAERYRFYSYGDAMLIS
jgi:S-adenosylmethionine:tRNA ribosyltransferase-isomerase